MVVNQVASAAGVEPMALTREHVEDYLDRELKTWSRIKYLQHLRGFAEWAGIEDPTAALKRPRQPRGVPKPASEAAIAAMLAVATPRTRTLLILGGWAGLRAFEMAKLEVEDLEQGPLGWTLRVQGKGGREDLLPVPEVVVEALRPWIVMRGHGRLWPTLTSAGVQQAVKHCARKAGLRITCHQLRHRYGTQLYAQNPDLLLLQQLMRHEDPAVTAVYTKVANRAAARLVDMLPPPLAA